MISTARNLSIVKHFLHRRQLQGQSAYMNELQVAAAAPLREAGFSLYSTDTEEQVSPPHLTCRDWHNFTVYSMRINFPSLHSNCTYVAQQQLTMTFVRECS